MWKRKRPAGWGRWSGYALAADSYGTWVFTPARSTFTSDDGTGRLSRCEVAQDSHERGRPSLVLLPTTGWFVAHWVLNANRVVSVDISTPPTQSGTDWSFDDLELDPFVLQDGTFGVEDEEDFVSACDAGLISSYERVEARRAVEVLRQELTSEPSLVTQAGRRLLADAVHRDLPPLAAPDYPSTPRRQA